MSEAVWGRVDSWARVRQALVALSVPVLIGAASAASLAMRVPVAVPTIPGAVIPALPPVLEREELASGKLLHVDRAVGALVVELMVASDRLPPQLRTFVLDGRTEALQHGRDLRLELQTGKCVTVGYVTVHGVNQARRVLITDVPNRV